MDANLIDRMFFNNSLEAEQWVIDQIIGDVWLCNLSCHLITFCGIILFRNLEYLSKGIYHCFIDRPELILVLAVSWSLIFYIRRWYFFLDRLQDGLIILLHKSTEVLYHLYLACLASFLFYFDQDRHVAVCVFMVVRIYSYFLVTWDKIHFLIWSYKNDLIKF